MMSGGNESDVRVLDPLRTRGWILYDDSCGFCRRWVPFWEGTLRRRGFDIAPLQAEWVAEKLKTDGTGLTEDLRLLLSDGRHVQGADVYRFAMKCIWWAYPLYLFSVTPLLRPLFDRGYRTFAKHRHQVSRFCRLPGAG
jgi:predicted DCC family thiol-disulfide oxidoreductase YuxK